MMEWWARLLAGDRPSAVTRAGGLLVMLGALNALQIVLLVVLLTMGDEVDAPPPGFIRVALVAAPIQVVYGVLRLATGLSVLAGRAWAWPAGIGMAALQMLGITVLAAALWNAEMPEIAGALFALRAVLGLTVAIIIALDALVIHGLIRNPPGGGAGASEMGS